MPHIVVLECPYQSIYKNFRYSRPICCRALEQIVDMCIHQDRSDVNRIPRYLYEYILSRGWPLTNNTVGMVESLLRVISMHLHLSQFNCSL